MTGEVSPWDDREQVSHHYLNVKANSRCVITDVLKDAVSQRLLFRARKKKNIAKSWLKHGQTFYRD